MNSAVLLSTVLHRATIVDQLLWDKSLYWGAVTSLASPHERSWPAWLFCYIIDCKTYACSYHIHLFKFVLVLDSWCIT